MQRIPKVRQARLIAIVAVSLVLGGGGVPYPLPNMLVQLVVLGILLWPARAPESALQFGKLDRALLVLIAITVALPVLQVIKLPPELWTKLAGRELVLASLTAAEMPDAWMSFSVDPARTMMAALSLIPAVGAALLVANAPVRDRSYVLKSLAAMGLFMVLLGTIQLSSGNRILIPYDQIRNPHQLHGLFAYHNPAGLFLDICLLIVILLPQQLRARNLELGLRIGIGLMLAIAVVLTQSRSSLALAIVPCAALAWRIGQSLLARKGRLKEAGHRAVVGGTVLVITCIASVSLLLSNTRVQQALSRFDDLQDARPAIWQDSWSAWQAFWPAGAGTGTFTTVFPIYESLENLVPAVTNRAHNDFLELGIESGIVGYAVLLCWVAFLLVRLFRKAVNDEHRAQKVICATAFVMIAGQALIDYPLRNEAMLAIAGLLVGLLTRPPDYEGKQT